MSNISVHDLAEVRAINKVLQLHGGGKAQIRMTDKGAVIAVIFEGFEVDRVLEAYSAMDYLAKNGDVVRGGDGRDWYVAPVGDILPATLFPWQGGLEDVEEDDPGEEDGRIEDEVCANVAKLPVIDVRAGDKEEATPALPVAA